MNVCRLDLSLLHGHFTLADVPPADAWMLRHFRGEKTRRVAIYCLNFSRLADFLTPDQFLSALQDNLGITCSRSVAVKCVKLLGTLTKMADQAKREMDMQKLSELKLGGKT